MNEFHKITNEDGEILVKTARKVVTEFLKNKNIIKLEDDFEKKYSFNSGIFVTLNTKSGLRGCIGYPLPDKKLFKALTESAISAATEDPRFPSVKSDELNEITFEITVLTPPIEIKVHDPMEYPSKIRVGKDGLIVKLGFNSGLLLPQVPKEYGWDEKEFLENTCEKAGLPKESWKDRQIKILKFEGIVFKETEPFGNVIRVEL